MSHLINPQLKGGAISFNQLNIEEYKIINLFKNQC